VVLAAYWRVRVVADEESVTVRDVYTTYRLPWRDIAAVDVDRAAGWHLRARTLRLRTAAGPVREARVTAVGAELVHAMWLEHRGPHWRPTPVPVGPWYPLPTWPRVEVGPAQPPPDADPRWPWTPPGSTAR
jgi:hypothetical protein